MCMTMSLKMVHNIAWFICQIVTTAVISSLHITAMWGILCSLSVPCIQAWADYGNLECTHFPGKYSGNHHPVFLGQSNNQWSQPTLGAELRCTFSYYGWSCHACIYTAGCWWVVDCVCRMLLSNRHVWGASNLFCISPYSLECCMDCSYMSVT